MDELVRRSVPAPSRDGAYLVSCSLHIENEIREKPSSGPWQEYELTGHRHGTFEAVIANCILDPLELVSKPSVFEWPEGRMFIAMQVTNVDQQYSPAAAESWRTSDKRLFEHVATRTHVRGIVLGIAQYGARPIDEAEARRRLGMADPKRLTP